MKNRIIEHQNGLAPIAVELGVKKWRIRPEVEIIVRSIKYINGFILGIIINFPETIGVEHPKV